MPGPMTTRLSASHAARRPPDLGVSRPVSGHSLRGLVLVVAILFDPVSSEALTRLGLFGFLQGMTDLASGIGPGRTPPPGRRYRPRRVILLVLPPLAMALIGEAMNLRSAPAYAIGTGLATALVPWLMRGAPASLAAHNLALRDGSRPCFPCRSGRRAGLWLDRHTRPARGRLNGHRCRCVGCDGHRPGCRGRASHDGLGMTGHRFSLALALLTILSGPALAQAVPELPPIPSDDARILPVLGTHGMVSSQDALATRIGVAILKGGGNAVDAAVAVGFALAVTLPQAGNLGGGGFMLVRLAATGETVAIDFRETAPAAATADMFLAPDGQPIAAHPSAPARPSVSRAPCADWAEAHRLHGSGRFTLADLVAPARALARDGFPWRAGSPIRCPAPPTASEGGLRAEPVFFRDGRPLQRGETLVQPDLAGTLTAIAEQGPMRSIPARSRSGSRRRREMSAG